MGCSGPEGSIEDGKVLLVVFETSIQHEGMDDNSQRSVSAA